MQHAGPPPPPAPLPPQALDLFNRMVRAAPTFAEAYNKRGTVLYLTQRYREAIADARITLEMNP